MNRDLFKALKGDIMEMKKNIKTIEDESVKKRAIKMLNNKERFVEDIKRKIKVEKDYKKDLKNLRKQQKN